MVDRINYARMLERKADERELCMRCGGGLDGEISIELGALRDGEYVRYGVVCSLECRDEWRKQKRVSAA